MTNLSNLLKQSTEDPENIELLKKLALALNKKISSTSKNYLIFDLGISGLARVNINRDFVHILLRRVKNPINILCYELIVTINDSRYTLTFEGRAHYEKIEKQIKDFYS
ncbi:MAG: hypothetical protein L3J07_04700 [Candidatus Magasanikbacteria bacterium]|nr:hypothetical protein [Candidatus Magasanikbacteria bacterium]